MTHSLTNPLMTAIVQDRYGSADVLQLREIERPRPGADEVIVRVHAAGVDFGVWHLMEGLPYAVRLATELRRPVNAADLRVLAEMLETGTLAQVVDRRYPLSQVPDAVRALATGHSRGKSVITINPSAA